MRKILLSVIGFLPLFRLEGKQPMAAGRLQDFINVYYEGLIADNVTRRNIPKEKLVPVSAKLTPDKTEKGDLATFTGSVSSFDWLAQTFRTPYLAEDAGNGGAIPMRDRKSPIRRGHCEATCNIFTAFATNPICQRIRSSY
jgi:hypothetical protein